MNSKELSESTIQASCVKWLWNKHPETRGLFFEINNNPLNAVDGANRLALGMVKGIPDTCFLWASQAWFIEFKDAKGKQSKAQKLCEARFAQVGVKYLIVRDLCSFQELINIILNYD